MRYKEGTNKQRMMLMPACLDEHAPENHLCRVISAFTERLDIVKPGYARAGRGETGCRPYDPRMNRYIYGYMNRARSSRQLEAETQRNVEVMRLTDGLTPDEKTVSGFRKDNAAALRETFGVFVRMFRELGL